MEKDNSWYICPYLQYHSDQRVGLNVPFAALDSVLTLRNSTLK